MCNPTLFIAILLTIGDPPPNNQCHDATPISGEGIFPFDNRLADQNITERCDRPEDPPVLRDVWYCWTAPCTGLVSIDTCGGTTLDTMLEVYQGCVCPVTPARSLDCNDDACSTTSCRVPTCAAQSAVEFVAEEGRSYLIRLGSTAYLFNGEPGSTGSFLISCAPQAAPRCSITYGNPQPPDEWNAWVSDGETYRIADSFTASADGQIDRLCWWGAYLRDGQECPNVIHQDGFEIRYYLDEGGVPGTLVAGSFGSDLALNLTDRGRTGRALLGEVREYQYSAEHAPVAVSAGQCYWIEITNKLGSDCVWHWEEGRGLNHRAAQQAMSSALPGPYQPTDVILADMALSLPIAITESPICAPRPVNDDCADAIPTASGQSVPFDSTGATTDGPESYYGCSFGPPGCHDFPLGDEQIHRDIWFTFAAETTGRLSVAACDSLFDTKIALYEGSDGGFACPHSTQNRYRDRWNDDACSPGQVGTGSGESMHAAASPLAGKGTSNDSDCFVEHVAPFCDDKECAGRVCVYQSDDVYGSGYENCCTQTWDHGCARVAQEICRDPAVSGLENGLQSRIDVPVRAGGTYTIRIGGYRGQGGPGRLTVDLTPVNAEGATLADVASFMNCFTGPCASVGCEPPLYAPDGCMAFDFDADGDVDRLDHVFMSFALSP